MNRTTLVRILAFLVAAAALAGCSSTSGGAESEVQGASGSTSGTDAPSRFEGSIPAPEFPSDLDWINTSGPVTWDDLRGKIVVLDFWTYGCINCIHMIPVLERLQEKYADELVVVGIHSAKFENEGSTENIRQIAGRYGRTEPIVNDFEFRVWNSWGARAWPTIGLVDPRGNVVAFDSGEIPYEALDTFISGVLDRFNELGLIDRTPFALYEDPDPGFDSLLQYPGKVLADLEGGRLFISDSNHNRIIVSALDSGDVVDVVGSGLAALSDGPFESAAFAKPQGLAVSGDTLFVADLDNHAIREVDLAGRSVRTIAGTGRRGSGAPAPGQVIPHPTQYDLRSPWALELVGDNLLYVAMAGTHQIWQYDIDAAALSVAVGNGSEALVNNSFTTSELAQPSGLYYTDGKLYFADSESSTIRVADFDADTLSTVSGPLQNSLFVFGDVDGAVGVSRLQHPLGVTGSPDGTIYFADTYNSRIKEVDPETLETRTIFGLGGSGGYRDGGAAVAEFDEPGGLDYANGRLYVADTNNHAMRIVDLATGLVETLVLGRIDLITGAAGAPAPDERSPSLRTATDVPVTLFADTTPAGLSVLLDEQVVGAGSGQIHVDLVLPEGYKINPLIESTFALTVSGEGEAPGGTSTTAVRVDPSLLSGQVNALSFAFPATFGRGAAMVRIRFSIYYCETDSVQLCILDDSEVVLPVMIQENGTSEIRVQRTIELPDLPTFGEL